MLGGYRRRTAGPDRDTWPVAHGQDIFRDDVFFVESQVARDRPHESSIEDAPGKLIPLLVFDGLQKTRGDARRG